MPEHVIDLPSRSYVVGLPVVVTVYADGSVTAEVDLSEAADIDPEHAAEGQSTADHVLDADREAITKALDAGTVSVS